MSRHGMGSCKVPCQSEKVLRIIAIFKDCPLRLGVKPYGWQHVTDAVRHSHPLCSPGLAAATLNMYLLRTLSVNSDPILQNSCPATCRKRPETFAKRSPGKCTYSGHCKQTMFPFLRNICPATCRKRPETFANGSPGKCYYSGPHETFAKGSPGKCYYSGPHETFDKGSPGKCYYSGRQETFAKGSPGKCYYSGL